MTTRTRPSYVMGKDSVRPIVPDYTQYHTAVKPEQDEPDWWAGAPSVVRAMDGTIWLACRMREAESPRGERGYEIRLLRSADGYDFEPVHAIHRDELGTVSVERPALVQNPLSGKFRLYICRAGKPEPSGWYVAALADVDDPRELDPRTAEKVLGGDPGTPSQGMKDPFVLVVGGLCHMFFIGYGLSGGARELPYVATSPTGRRFAVPREPLLHNTGWHTHYTRPACVMPMGGVFVLYYEGSGADWFDPPYNIQGGIAVSTDLRAFEDVTPTAPIFTSPTPGRYGTLRYTDYLCLEDRVLFYYEAARENDSFELRVTEVLL